MIIKVIMDESNYKQRILNYINKRDNETYELLDIFQKLSLTHGGLHPLGYKLLKNDYKFMPVEINNFKSTPNEYLLLGTFVKGLFYMTKPKDNKTTIYLTDSYTANVIQLSGGNMVELADTINSYRD